MTRVRMSDRAVQVSASQGEEVLRRAIERWRDDAMTAHLAREGAALLVLDAEAERLLHAAGSAVSYGAGIAGADGTVMPALRLSEQIRRIGMVGARPRMVRLRLDPRGVAPPTVVLVARAALDAERAALLLAPLGPLPLLRPTESVSDPAAPDAPEAATADDGAASGAPVPVRSDGAAPGPDAARVSAEPVSPPEPAGRPARFVWRSDGEGVLTNVSATHPDLAAVIAGRAWADLAADGIVEGAALEALLRPRTDTFRALPLLVRGRAFEHEIEVSGAPMGRPGQAGTGLGGFALLKARHPRPEDETAPPDLDLVRAPPEASSLSVNEHAAFREVARLLVLRFAPDDAAETGDAPDPERIEGPTGGSVTPFPTAPARAAEEVRTRAALAELLERLPAGVLVYRDDAVLFASRAFLALAGYPDQASLSAAGLRHLFRGLAPGERGGHAPVPFGKADGDTVVLAVDHARLDWDGAPAELCLARAVEAEPASPPVPPNDARLRAEQVLDSLEEAVVTLDAEGRVVGLNPSAAELVHAHPKEIVGGRFADLFAPESLPALEAAVTDSRRSGASELLGVTPRSGAVALRLRIARLFGEDAPGYCASLREIREDEAAPTLPPATIPAAPPPVAAADEDAAGAWKARALARVGREIRPSLTAILSLTDMMLSDRFDRADAERLEAYLREVRLSGGRIAAILDDLRDLAAIQAGRQLTFTRVGLNDLVSGCIGAIQAQAARDRIVVRTSLGPDLPAFLADERSIRQAALTVIGNAIRVTEAGGQVIVSTTLADRGEVALRVRDTGPGMSPEAVTSALEPFREGADAATEGGGFGLTLTKALVEANRGRFRIGSRKDEGTLVEMIFPAA
ncbi:MAG: ATP-binding protein [Methylorubrum rhodinum]|uniref:ATP-binding protein n=1 Tax=Methylorubrum rhodinum TaxID=29428 RepID=UPI003BB068B6